MVEKSDLGGGLEGWREPLSKFNVHQTCNLITENRFKLLTAVGSKESIGIEKAA
ncbi:MAG: hypothetical protein ACE5I5_09025 [Candidatus Heimdallarchaeota archaeon]